MVTHPAVERFWTRFLDGLPDPSPVREAGCAVESFGDSPELAAALGERVRCGEKTATCSSLWEWEAEGAEPPRVGQYTVVTGARGEPLCIIRTTEVEIRAFRDVDAAFAAAEGEGDRSLEHWRREHWRFFTRSLAAIGRAPTEEMPLVCERFRVVFP